MLKWLKNINKEYPEFWKEYLLKMEHRAKPKRFVVLSLETSGFNTEKDVVFSISSVGIVNDNILINDSFDIVLLQYKYLHDNVLANDFIIHSKQTKLAEPQAIQAFLEFISNSILVGHRIHLEVEMINKALERLDCGRLKNEAIDIDIMYSKWIDDIDKTHTLDELCSTFKIKNPEIHTSSEDTFNIALLFLKLKSRLKITA
jgi:DNA polymerase-3 subunit epsilon